MGENIRYFTYKYNILYDDWFNNLNNIYIKINAHIHSMSNNDDVCTAGAITGLCEAYVTVDFHNSLIATSSVA